MAEWRRTFSLFFARRVVLLAMLVLGLMLFMAVAGQWLLPHEPMVMKSQHAPEAAQLDLLERHRRIGP